VHDASPGSFFAPRSDDWMEPSEPFAFRGYGIRNTAHGISFHGPGEMEERSSVSPESTLYDQGTPETSKDVAMPMKEDSSEIDTCLRLIDDLPQTNNLEGPLMIIPAQLTQAIPGSISSSADACDEMSMMPSCVDSASTSGSEQTSEISSSIFLGSDWSDDEATCPEFLTKRKHEIASKIVQLYNEVPANSDSPDSNIQESTGNQTSAYSVGCDSLPSYTNSSGADCDGHESPDEDGQRKKRKLRPESKDHNEETRPLLACPFNKRDPWRYSHCQTFTLREINRVK